MEAVRAVQGRGWRSTLNELGRTNFALSLGHESSQACSQGRRETGKEKKYDTRDGALPRSQERKFLVPD